MNLVRCSICNGMFDSELAAPVICPNCKAHATTEPVASPPAFDLVARLVGLWNQVFALRRDAENAGFGLIPAKLARMQADLSDMADDQRAVEETVRGLRRLPKGAGK